MTQGDRRAAPQAVRTPRLVLRRITADDVDAWAEALYADPEVLRYLPAGNPVPHERAAGNLAAFDENWRRDGFGLWGVEESATGRFIGHCGLRYLPDVDEVEVAYSLSRDMWGKGLATEGAAAALDVGFARLGLERVVAYAVPANAASRRVMDKIGMSYERETHLFGLDVVQYAIPREDWEHRQTGL